MKQSNDSPQVAIRRAALNLLARRDYTQHELKQKLKNKGFSLVEMEPIIIDLIHAGLINDQRFTENYIYSRRTKGYGPIRISIELQHFGVSEDVIAEHLEITDNAWFTEVRKVWQKHFKGKLATDYKDRAKQMRYLQYRGFTQEHIESIFKENM